MKKVARKKRVLHILLGFLIASTSYLYLEYKYEKKTLDAFIQSVYATKDLNPYDEEAVVLAAMQKTHLQMAEGEITAMHLQLNSFEKLFTSPLMSFALTKDGACGGNSLVLAQILNGMGYKVRPAQMTVKGKNGGHIILEARVNEKWVALDPLYNLAFKNEQGQLASIAEIQTNWDYYKLQTPGNYNPDYKFEGFRYTNWNKVPVLGNIAKATVGLFIGKAAAEKFSLRAHLLNPKKFLFYVSFYLLGFSFISILNKRYFKLHLPRMQFKKIPSPNTAPTH